MNTSSSNAPNTESSGDGPPPGSGGAATNAPGAEAAIAYAKVYPGIGFARVGNSPDGFFVGPEVPGRPAEPTDGRFKDREGRIKRQAARFRVYAFDANDNVVKELTAAEADITWTVHLANAKGEWFKFENEAREIQANTGGPPLVRRNKDVADRNTLVIDPGPRSISGTNIGAKQDRVRFDTGRFLGKPVELGELRTDEAGRLLVLGGSGQAASVVPSGELPKPLEHFANNDTWYDDISDGPVTASVVLKTGQQVPMKAGSWVVIGPPDYAPAVQNIVTLYDVQVSVARAAGWQTAPERVSFTRDVFPILARSVGYRWVNSRARRGHGQGAAGDLLRRTTLLQLSNKGLFGERARHRVFERLRNPNLRGEEAVAQANYNFMPQLAGDGDGGATPGEPTDWLSVLPHQYEVMRRWAEGDFDPDWPDVVTEEQWAELLEKEPQWSKAPEVAQHSIADFPVADQPHALDRAANEACVGGGFHPGIEVTYNVRDQRIYVEPHRLGVGLKPGDLTKRMAVPWHGDFNVCDIIWWPAQRPDEVIAETEFEAVLGAYGFDENAETKQSFVYEDLRFTTVPWARGLLRNRPRIPAAQNPEDPTVDVPASRDGDQDMVRSWSELGIVRPRLISEGRDMPLEVLVESERTPHFRLKDREAFHMMVNIESYPDFLPTAKEIAARFLEAARQFQESPRCPDVLRPFDYSIPAFRSRVDQIYTEAAQAADAFDPRSYVLSREYWIEYLTQFAPFNQIDGAWLRNIGRLGPIDEVHAMLFHVFIDELGNGDPKLNHANVYTDLLHNVGVYLPPVASRAYVDDERLIDGAFRSPLFQLVIGQFPEDFLPEALGMTLWIEWGSVGLKGQIKALEVLGIDPTYYSLHMGIDNSATGHGAMAKRAIEIYLDEIRASVGDEAMQKVWDRIWDGYVAFQIAGGIGQHLRDFAFRPPDAAAKVRKMMERKAHFGSQNHGRKQLGAKPINEWFADPKGFMDVLVASGYIIPGDVEHSPFFNLLKPTGPMFRVFTEDEIQLWESWTNSLHGQVPSIPGDKHDLWMEQMVKTLRLRQEGKAGHRLPQLTGKTSAGTVTKPVSWWFDRARYAKTDAGESNLWVVELLEALADPKNGWVIPGDPGPSLFISDRASGDHPMARVLGEIAPGSKNRTWRRIAYEWIEARCPIPPVTVTPPAERVAAEVPAVEEDRVLVAAGGVVAPGMDGAGGLAAISGVGAAAMGGPEGLITGGVAAPVPDAAGVAATAELSDGRSHRGVPLLLLFQNETWQPEYADVEILGNGSVH